MFLVIKMWTLFYSFKCFLRKYLKSFQTNLAPETKNQRFIEKQCANLGFHHFLNLYTYLVATGILINQIRPFHSLISHRIEGLGDFLKHLNGLWRHERIKVEYSYVTKCLSFLHENRYACLFFIKIKVWYFNGILLAPFLPFTVK